MEKKTGNAIEAKNVIETKSVIGTKNVMRAAIGTIKGKIRKLLDLLGKVRFLTMYYWILVIAILLFTASLAITNSIAKKGVKREYQEYNESLFEQAQGEMERNIKELIQIAYNIMANRDVNTYLNTTSLSERSKLLEDVIKPEFSSIQAIKSSIKTISLYDENGKLVANTGPFYRDMLPETTADEIKFSSLIQIEEKRYFGISVPLYNIDKTQIKGRCGECFILINMSYLDEILEGRLPTDDSSFVLRGSDGQIMVQRGAQAEEETSRDSSQMNDNSQMSDSNTPGWSIYQGGVEKTKWNLTLSVPNNTLYQNLNYLQRINGITYAIIGVLLLAFFVVIYASVLRPIREQTLFMNYYAKNRKSRMEVKSHNEMGILAENLNAMLDDIDSLTEENIRSKEQVLEANYQKKQSELLAYRNQINPHFMHNTFECIRGMALLYEVPDIAAISEALSRFFSYNVRGKGYAQVREIGEHIQDYASIIGYRFMNKYTISTEIDETVMDQCMPKMILQPLVENAVFHGLEPKEESGTVEIFIGRKDEKLAICVQDSGCGMDETELEAMRSKLKEFDRTSLLPMQKHGIGMVNIYRRLRLFYADQLEFNVTSKKGEGTRIEILVPMNMKMGEENVSGIFD